jgi:hypothetical protein
MNPPWWHRPVRFFLARKLRNLPAPLCRSCTNPIPIPTTLTDDLWDALVLCPHCGAGCSLLALGNRSDETTLPPPTTALPEDSTISTDSSPASNHWNIPARKRLNFILVFGTFWLLFTSIFLWAFLSDKSDSDTPGWVLGIFISVFVAIGLGTFFAGLRMAFVSYDLTIANRHFTYSQHLFGGAKHITVSLNSIQSVELTEFYQQNYRPVHGIEIRSSEGKIRFGSQLSVPEKQVLTAQLKAALLPQTLPPITPATSVPAAAHSPSHLPAPPTPPAFAIPLAPDGVLRIESQGRWHPALIIPALFILAVTSFMLFQGLRMLFNTVAPGSPTPPGAFRLLSSAFMIFWCSGPLLGVVISSTLLFLAWKLRFSHQLIEISRSSITRTKSSRSSSSSESWDLRELRQTIVVPVSSTNNSASYRGEIILNSTVLPFGLNRPKPELDAFAAAANQFIPPTPSPPHGE